MRGFGGKRLARCLALGIAIASLPFASSTAATPRSSCDRACMRQVLDQYLNAVFAHSPNAAPLAPNARATENAAPLPNGAGLWRTATGYGAIERRYFDVLGGQAAFFGVINEGTEPAIVSLRVKIDQRMISEAEWTVARKGAFGLFSIEELLAMPPPPDVPLPAGERTPRAQMVAAADSYFDGLEKHDGSQVPRIAGCERIENGVRVTHRHMPPPGGSPPSGNATSAAPGAAQEHLSGDCTAGFEMFAKTIAKTTQRRYPVVDEDLGVVMGATIFHRPPGVTLRRNLLTEFFFNRAGKIGGIYAAMYYLHPSAPDTSGW
jgi:hypothetical protein